MGLLLAVELAKLSAGWLLAVERGVEPLGRELLPHTHHRHPRRLEMVGNLLVRPGIRPVRIRFQENVRPPTHGRWVRAGVDEPLERLPLLIGQSDNNFAGRNHGRSSLISSRSIGTRYDLAAMNH